MSQCPPTTVEATARTALHRYHGRSEEHTSELQSPCNLVCRLLLEKKKKHPLLPPKTYKAQNSRDRRGTLKNSRSCRIPAAAALPRRLLRSRPRQTRECHSTHYRQ